MEDSKYLTSDGCIIVKELFREVGNVSGLLFGILYRGTEKKFEDFKLEEMIERVRIVLDTMEEQIFEILDIDEEEEDLAIGLMMMGMLLKISSTFNNGDIAEEDFQGSEFVN